MLVTVAEFYIKKAMKQCHFLLQSLSASCSYCHIASDAPFNSSGVSVGLYEVTAGHSSIVNHMFTK